MQLTCLFITVLLTKVINAEYRRTEVIKVDLRKSIPSICKHQCFVMKFRYGGFGSQPTQAENCYHNCCRSKSRRFSLNRRHFSKKY